MQRCRVCAAAALSVVMVSRGALAQGNLSTQGFGYPVGQGSTAIVAAGGAFGEFDPASAINPAALADWGRAGAHFQYSPEFRTVNTPQGSDKTTTIRFPLLSAGVPVGSRLVLGLSLSTLLDRSWQTTQTSQIRVGDTLITSTETFRSAGGITDIRLGGGWSPFSWLRAGVGLHLFTGRNQITIGRTFPDTGTIKPLPFSDTSTYNYSGTGVSGGVEIRPSPAFAVGASLRVGGALRAHRHDTLLTRATVPPRVGAAFRYDGIAGLSLAVASDWEGWSRMSGLGSAALGPADAWSLHGGAEIAGPRIGTDRGLLLRVGGRTRTLPFRANGSIVRETAVSGGFGIPFGLNRAALDLALERAMRSAPIGVSEGAWTLSVGLTVRP